MILRYISPKQGKPYLEADGETRINCDDPKILMRLMGAFMDCSGCFENGGGI